MSEEEFEERANDLRQQISELNQEYDNLIRQINEETKKLASQ